MGNVITTAVEGKGELWLMKLLPEITSTRHGLVCYERHSLFCRYSVA